MYGWDRDEEPTGEMPRRMPARRRDPRDRFDDDRFQGGRFDDGRYDDGRYDRGRYDDGRYDDGRFQGGRYDHGRYGDGHFDDDRYFERPDPAPDNGLTMDRRHRPASDYLRSAGRRVVNVLGWVGLLVFAPLIVGILAGALGQQIGL